MEVFSDTLLVSTLRTVLRSNIVVVQHRWAVCCATGPRGALALSRSSVHSRRKSLDLCASIQHMEPTTPQRELAKHIPASNSAQPGTLYSQLTENPFFAAVRSTLVLAF